LEATREGEVLDLGSSSVAAGEDLTLNCTRASGGDLGEGSEDGSWELESTEDNNARVEVPEDELWVGLHPGVKAQLREDDLGAGSNDVDDEGCWWLVVSGV